MKDFAARFSAPLEITRPRGGRLIEAFSPKLKRRLQLFDHRAFAQWVRLETDPAVIGYCERPTRLGPPPGDCLVDFWVTGQDEEALLLLASTQAEQAPAAFDGVAIRVVSAAELAAASQWVSNWTRMLPVIIAAQSLFSKTLLRSITQVVREPLPLARVQHELSMGDPSLVRGAIFELLRIGRLGAPSLHVVPLTLHTVLEPVS